MRLFFANNYLHNLDNRHLEVCLNQFASTILIFPRESVEKDKIIKVSRLVTLCICKNKQKPGYLKAWEIKFSLNIFLTL